MKNKLFMILLLFLFRNNNLNSEISQAEMNTICDYEIFCVQLSHGYESGVFVNLNQINNWKLADTLSQKKDSITISFLDCKGAYSFRKHIELNDETIIGQYSSATQISVDTMYFINQDTYEFDYFIKNYFNPLPCGNWIYLKNGDTLKEEYFEDGLLVRTVVH